MNLAPCVFVVVPSCSVDCYFIGMLNIGYRLQEQVGSMYLALTNILTCYVSTAIAFYLYCRTRCSRGVGYRFDTLTLFCNLFSINCSVTLELYLLLLYDMCLLISV